MRIRNSRPLFPLPLLPPEAFLRSAYRCSRGSLYFNNRFLVEEANRCIGWSCYPLRKPSTPDVEEAQPHDGLLPVIAGETKPLNHVEKKNGKENFVPEMPSHVLQRCRGTGNGGRKSKLSRTYERERDKVLFSAPIVLGLPAASFRPGSERQLPLKKRGKCRGTKIEENEVQKEGGETVISENALVEVKIETAVFSGKEIIKEPPDSVRSNFIKCVLNCESSLPPPSIDGLQEQDKVEMFLEQTDIQHEGKPKRGRGRPKKAKDIQSIGTSGMGKSKCRGGRSKRV